MQAVCDPAVSWKKPLGQLLHTGPDTVVHEPFRNWPKLQLVMQSVQAVALELVV